jgi:methionine-gamma-lyase
LQTAKFNDATRCVHAGEDRHGQKASLTTDIAQTSVFVLPNVEALRRAAEGVSGAYLYTRFGNPTTAAAEEKIAALENADACVVTASGMAAILCVALSVLNGGDEVLSMLDVYGGTLRLFEEVLARYGVRTRFVPYEDLPRIESCFTERTRMLFLESPTNPTLRCLDLDYLAKLAHRRNAVVVVDNTFATPILQKPLALGADLVIHSATKYLGGHSDVTAGAVAGSRSWLEQVRKMMILSGGCPDPFCSYLLVRGLKTLELRVERSCQNARAVAHYLSAHPKVERVFYPGLDGHEGHALAKTQMRDFGMMVSFDVKAGAAAAQTVIDSLELWYLATSLGGVESTVSYPVLSSHVGFPEERLRQLGVSPATIRLSLGIESASDLIADLDRALQQA